jgi:hypothetical protein
MRDFFYLPWVLRVVSYYSRSNTSSFSSQPLALRQSCPPIYICPHIDFVENALVGSPQTRAGIGITGTRVGTDILHAGTNSIGLGRDHHAALDETQSLRLLLLPRNPIPLLRPRKMSIPQTALKNPNKRRGPAKLEGGILVEKRAEPAAIKAKYEASLLEDADPAAFLPAVLSTTTAPTLASSSHPAGAPNKRYRDSDRERNGHSSRRHQQPPRFVAALVEVPSLLLPPRNPPLTFLLQLPKMSIW